MILVWGICDKSDGSAGGRGGRETVSIGLSLSTENFIAKYYGNRTVCCRVVGGKKKLNMQFRQVGFAGGNINM